MDTTGQNGDDRGRVPVDGELPLTSIIIPFHNRIDLTVACLRSIRENTVGPYEVILIDDASSESVEGLHREFEGPQVKFIRNHVRQSFSKNNNSGARAAGGKYLCLLNNDTLVRPNWLAPMVRLLEREPGIGVLGNKHLFPDSGLLHHCGLACDDTGHPFHLHPHTDPGAPAVNYQRDVPIVTFACVMIPRAVYGELGGLDESFLTGYEDCDFCMRAREAGYRVTYTPSSTICHYGQATPNRKANDQANLDLFRKKWMDKLERGGLARITREDHAYNAAHLRRPRLRPRDKAGLHFAVDMEHASAFAWATADLAIAVAENGEIPVSIPKSVFLHRTIPFAKARKLRKMMRRRPNGTFHVKWSHYWPNHMKQELYGEINAEFFCTNYEFRGNNLHRDIWTRNVETNGLKKLPVSDFNRKVLLSLGLPGSDCITVPLGYSPEAEDLFKNPAERSAHGSLNILLMTNSHDLYRYGTDLAVKALAAAFGPADPVVVHVKDYGTASGSTKLREWIAAEKRFPRTVWHTSFLSKEGLMRLYGGMDLLLAPFRGEGFAMKVIDAMAVGLPVYMPAYGGPTEFVADGTYVPMKFDIAPVGECYDREAYYIGDGACWCEPRLQEMTEVLRGIGSGRDMLRETARLAFKHVRGRFTWKNAARRLVWALRAWEQGRVETACLSRGPDNGALSVIIPTRDRIEILDKTLEAYGQQTLPPSDYELLLVNDHGPLQDLSAAAKRHAGRVPVRVLDNRGPEGPAAARNLGMRTARGEVVLITGDDIVPDREFLAQHVEGHRRFPSEEQALVGRTLWHPSVPQTPFIEHITSGGGQQFNYSNMAHGKPAPFDRFYTSNVSLKRGFFAEEEELFSTKYHHAAFEDIEFGYRMHLRGMELRFWETARGYHLHPMDPAGFVERQRRAGRMLALLAMQRPGFVPDEHQAFLRALEFLRHCPEFASGLPRAEWKATDSAIPGLLSSYTDILETGARLKDADCRFLAAADRQAWVQWLQVGQGTVWDTINELAIRTGMAEEWAVNEEEARRAAGWAAMLALPRMVGPGGTLYWKMPFAAPTYVAALFPNSRLVFVLSKILRDTPGLGYAVKRMEKSAPGRIARRLLTRLAKRG